MARFLWTSFVLVSFGFSPSGCHHDGADDASPSLEVTYYYLPECPVCKGIRPRVANLETEFPGRVKSRNLNCQTDASKAAVAELGFTLHGLVVHDAEGKVVFRQADHTVKMEQVRDEIKKLIELSSTTSPAGGW